MGYTKFTTELILRHIDSIQSVVDLGSSNLYLEATDKPPFVDQWYHKQGIWDYTCIDLAGDNKALRKDLAHPIDLAKRFDLVCDIGFSEHVVQMKDYEIVSFHDGHIHSVYPKGEINITEGYYNCWLNKHNLCKVSGLIISENPKTGNWPEHGFTYLTENFYRELAELTDYEILELGENAASGNDADGWNIYSVLRKKSKRFPDFEQFKGLSFKEK